MAISDTGSKEEKTKIEIVKGDGSNLDISSVEEHLNISKPNTQKENKQIIMPKENKKTE